MDRQGGWEGWQRWGYDGRGGEEGWPKERAGGEVTQEYPVLTSLCFPWPKWTGRPWRVLASTWCDWICVSGQVLWQQNEKWTGKKDKSGFSAEDAPAETDWILLPFASLMPPGTRWMNKFMNKHLNEQINASNILVPQFKATPEHCLAASSTFVFSFLSTNYSQLPPSCIKKKKKEEKDIISWKEKPTCGCFPFSSS